MTKIYAVQYTTYIMKVKKAKLVKTILLCKYMFKYIKFILSPFIFVSIEEIL